jgi:hypothetical protein
MLDQDIQAGNEALQFDRVISESTSAAAASTLAVTCAVCQASIETEYFDVNGNVVCSRCRTAAESAATTPRGIVPLMTAGVFGLGAGLVGAVIYYAVMAIANLEIGIVAILIGYMVGYAVRRGARGRGGRRFQVLAVALTYASIALAYSPMVFKQVLDTDRSARTALSATKSSGRSNNNSNTAAATQGERGATTKLSGGRVLLSLVFVAAFIAALPVLGIIGSFPFGLISAFIIFIGLKQAWTMTGVTRLQILGPYRVGAAPAPAPA